jgi:hypothetical protein
MPGIIPAINISPTDTPAITPYKTKGILGGIMTPMVPAAAVIAVANPSLYCFSFIDGIIKEPIAETVAGPDPDIAAKNMQANIVTKANPPVIQPTKLSAKLTNLLDIPQLYIKLPAKIKKGIAKRGKLSKVAKAFCITPIIGRLEVSNIVIIVANPKPTPIGILREIEIMSIEINNIVTIFKILSIILYLAFPFHF